MTRLPEPARYPLVPLREARPVPTFSVTAYPHPLAAERVHGVIPEGATLVDMLGDTQALAFVNGDLIPREFWPRVRPRAGTMVVLRAVPEGGGDKGILRLVATLTLAVVAPYAAAGVLGTTVGSLGFAGTALATGITLAGNLAINALIPPPAQDVPGFGGTPNRLPSISNTRNRARPFGALPRYYGRFRAFPDAAVNPVTEAQDNQQFLRQVFCFGYGPLQFEPDTLRIGDTPVFDENGDPNFDGVELEWREGFDDDAPLTIFAETIGETPLNIQLNEADGFSVRTTAANTTELVVELTAPQGLVAFDNSGNKSPITVEFDIQYAPTGTGNWTIGNSTQAISAQNTVSLDPGGSFRFDTRRYRIGLDKATGEVKAQRYVNYFPGYGVGGATWPSTEYPIATVDFDPINGNLENLVDRRTQLLFDRSGGSSDFVPSIDGTTVAVSAGALIDPFKLEGNQTTTVRDSKRFAVPSPGQYDVRIRRLTADNASTQVFDDTFWTALRSITTGDPIQPVAGRGLALLGLRIKATDQLNGVLDQVSCVVNSILPVWDSGEGAFIQQPTSNPAWIYRDILTGSANGRALATSRMDDATLIEWAAECEANGRAFNAPIDPTTVFRAAADVAAVGRAAFSLDQGQYSVVRDVSQSVATQMFTPHNSWGFRGRKVFRHPPHALKVRYIDPEADWREAERIVYADGYDENNATRFETLQLFGVTDADQAFKDGRYHMAVGQLRPETYEFDTDIEYAACRRGDRIRVQHDCLAVGLGSGRLTGSSVGGGQTSLSLDHPVTMAAGKDYGIRVRLPDGTQGYAQVVNDPGEQTVVVADAVIAGVAGDLWAFGELGLETLDAIVKEVRPLGDELQAHIVAVPYNEAIYSADTGTIPAFEPGITLPAEREALPPPVPVIDNVRSDETAARRNSDGSLEYLVVVAFSVPSGQVGASLVEVQARTEGFLAWERQAGETPARGEAFIPGYGPGDSVELRARAVSERGVASAWTAITTHDIQGDTLTLPDPANPGARERVQGVEIYWDPVPATVAAVEIHVSDTSDIQDATLLATTAGPLYFHETGDTTSRYYWVRSVSRSGSVRGAFVGPVQEGGRLAQTNDIEEAAVSEVSADFHAATEEPTAAWEVLAAATINITGNSPCIIEVGARLDGDSGFGTSRASFRLLRDGVIQRTYDDVFTISSVSDTQPNGSTVATAQAAGSYFSTAFIDPAPPDGDADYELEAFVELGGGTGAQMNIMDSYIIVTELKR